MKAGSSTCFGMILTDPARGTSIAFGAGVLITTVCASGAVTSQFLPSILSRSWMDGCSVSSYAIWKLKRTSSEVMG